MKKITIYFKSGNVLKFKCKSFEFIYDKETNKKDAIIKGTSMKSWMIDLDEIEAYTVCKSIF